MARDGTLRATRDDTSPHPYLVESAPPGRGNGPGSCAGRRPGTGSARSAGWSPGPPAPRAGLSDHPQRRPTPAQEVRAGTEDVIVVYELGLVGLYAGLAKGLWHRGGYGTAAGSSRCSIVATGADPGSAAALANAVGTA